MGADKYDSDGQISATYVQELEARCGALENLFEDRRWVLKWVPPYWGNSHGYWQVWYDGQNITTPGGICSRKRAIDEAIRCWQERRKSRDQA